MSDSAKEPKKAIVMKQYLLSIFIAISLLICIQANAANHVMTSNADSGAGTQYNVQVFEYNGYDAAEEDYTANATNNPKNQSTNSLPTVTTQAASNIWSTSATGNGNITGLGFPYPTAYGICWSTSADPTVEDNKTNSGPTSTTGAFTGSITSLTPGTTYYVRAYATNDEGTSYGEEQVFTASSNLLDNPGAELDYTAWTKTDGGSDWNTTTSDISPYSGSKLWVSSYEICTLTQTVDLITKGFSVLALDMSIPISASAYVATNPYCAGIATIKVELLNASDGVMNTYYICNTYIPENSLWTKREILISGYSTGLRKIRFTMTGIDYRRWGGQYGPAFDETNISFNASACANPTSGGTIATDQAGCTPFDPVAFTSSAVPTGYTGTLEYKWQSSITSSSSGFNDIDDAHSATFDPGSLTANTWYRRLSRVTCMGDWTDAAESNVVKVTVDPVSVGGSIAGSASVSSGTNSTSLTLSGFTGSVVKWQKSTDNWVTPVDVTNTTATLEATNLTMTTKYRAVVQSGVCSTSNSEDAIVTVDLVSVGGSVSGTGSITYGSSTGTMILSGHTGTVVKWQKMVDSNSWTDITNTTTTFSEIPTSVGTWQYRCQVKNGTCSATFSNALSIRVSPKELTITGAVAQNKIYDGTNTAQINGAMLVGVVSPDEVTLTMATAGTFAQTGIGTNIVVSTLPMTITGAGIGNYTLIQPTGLTATIAAKPISVTVTTGLTKVYGTADPVFTYTFSPELVGTDTFTGALSRVAGNNAGTYAITQSSLAAGTNYAVTFVPADFIITAKPITVTAVVTTQIYDGTISSTGIPSISPALIAGDTPAFIQAYYDKMAGTNKQLNPSGSVNDGNSGQNYAVNFANVGNGVIRPLAIVGNITAADKAYDGNTNAVILTRSLTGEISGDRVSYADGIANFDTPDAGENKTVTATGLSLSGADAVNYTVNTTAETIASIHQLSVSTSLTATPEVIQYSDEATLTAIIAGGAQLGGGMMAAHSVTFTIGGQVMKDASHNSKIPLVISGPNLVATLIVPLTETSLAGSMAPGVKPVTAAFNDFDENFSLRSNQASTTLTIMAENAIVDYTGDFSVQLPTGGTTNVVLRATVHDITAEPGGDAFAGDIRNATVTFVNRSTNTLLGTVPVTLLSPSDLTTGKAEFYWSGVPDGDYIIDVAVNNYYSCEAAPVSAIVEVHEPTGDYLTGGGYGSVLPEKSSEPFSFRISKRFNFGFDVKFDDNGTISHGHAMILLRRIVDDVHKLYRVTCNEITAVAVNVDDPSVLTGGFIGKAILTDITDPLLPVELANDLILKVVFSDRGYQGTGDDIAIKLWSGTNLSFSTDQTADMSLAGGDLTIHSSFNLDNGLLSGSGDIPLEPGNGASLAAYPNPSPGIINFKIKVDTGSMASLDILSMNGTLVSKVFEGYMDPSTDTNINYDSKLPRGIYFYRLKTSTQIIYGKIVIVRTY